MLNPRDRSWKHCSDLFNQLFAISVVLLIVLLGNVWSLLRNRQGIGSSGTVSPERVSLEDYLTVPFRRKSTSKLKSYLDFTLL